MVGNGVDYPSEGPPWRVLRGGESGGVVGHWMEGWGAEEVRRCTRAGVSGL